MDIYAASTPPRASGDTCGAEAIKRAMAEKPMDFLKMMVSLMPKEVEKRSDDAFHKIWLAIGEGRFDAIGTDLDEVDDDCSATKDLSEIMPKGECLTNHAEITRVGSRETYLKHDR